MTNQYAASRTPTVTTCVLFFGMVLTARLLGAHFAWFFQNDEVSLAAGIAALVQDNPLADTYRYGPQLGYHRLVQLLVMLVGGDLTWIPLIMIGLSAIAGAILPTCGLLMFPDVLSPRERWLLALLLAVNPVIWMSSRYGNSTMPSTALIAVAVTLLSARRGLSAEVLALTLFAAGIVVRADSVLVTPMLMVLLWQRHGRVRDVVTRMVGLGLLLTAAYAFAFAIDPRMATSVSDVASHLTNRFDTKFWEYLLWSTSPFACIAAIGGVMDLGTSRRGLLAIVLAWCLPVFGFYFASTTTPRYFIPAVVPVAIASAVGIFALGRALLPRRAILASGGLAALCGLPLFVGLGWFSPQSIKNLLRESQFETHVGPMWTGAFLYKTYFEPGFLAQSLRHGGFGKGNRTERAMDSSLTVVAAGSEKGRSIVVLLGGWNGHAFHYYANVHGARYTAKTPGPIFLTETHMVLGGTRLMTLARSEPSYAELTVLDVRAGDEIWAFGWNAEDESPLRAKLPRGVTLGPPRSDNGAVRQFEVRADIPSFDDAKTDHD